MSVSVPVQCDPALLPEPNHVMLNHLYALSIKVMTRLLLSELFLKVCSEAPNNRITWCPSPKGSSQDRMQARPPALVLKVGLGVHF